MVLRVISSLSSLPMAGVQTLVPRPSVSSCVIWGKPLAVSKALSESNVVTYLAAVFLGVACPPKVYLVEAWFPA